MIQWFEPFGSNQEEWRKVIVVLSKTAKTRMNKGGIGERLIESERDGRRAAREGEISRTKLRKLERN